jgi:hypothetical protein
VSLRSVRLVQLLGIALAFAGLVGFWLSRDVQRTVLSLSEQEVLGYEAGEFQASFVVATQQASVSAVQRRFRVGYSRAGRIIDALERYSAPDYPGWNMNVPDVLRVFELIQQDPAVDIRQASPEEDRARGERARQLEALRSG